MVRAFYTAYFVGLVCLFAGLGYAFGLKITLLLLGAMSVSGLLLPVLCSAPVKANSSRVKWGFNLPSFF